MRLDIFDSLIPAYKRAKQRAGARNRAECIVKWYERYHCMPYFDGVTYPGEGVVCVIKPD